VQEDAEVGVIQARNGIALTTTSEWLPHTTRAALTRLWQRGYDVRLANTGTRRAYHLVPAE
jgi:hypothetical protein